MGNKLNWFLFLTIISAKLSVFGACETGIGEIAVGNKVVEIELKEGDSRRTPSTIKKIMDDDGLVVLSMVASYCFKQIPNVKANISAKDRECAEQAQVEAKIPHKEKIFFEYELDYYEKSFRAQEVIQNKCSINALNIWKEAHTVVDSQDLKCATDMAPTIKKAVARNDEYFKEHSDPKFLKSLKLSKKEEKVFLESLKSDHENFKAIGVLFEKKPLKVKEFNQWLKGLEAMVEQHSYQVVSESEDGLNPDDQEELTSLLIKLNAQLPFIPSVCGRFLPDDFPEKIKTVSWQPSGSNNSVSSGGLTRGKTEKQVAH